MTSELSAFLVRQRIHEFMRQFMDFGENCTFFPREGGLRIPWSMPGAVHTWNSEHYFYGPVYLVFICTVSGLHVFVRSTLRSLCWLTFFRTANNHVPVWCGLAPDQETEMFEVAVLVWNAEFGVHAYTTLLSSSPALATRFFHSLFLSSLLSLSVLCERPRTCTILVVRDVGRVYEFRFIYAGKAVSLRSPRWLWGATECLYLLWYCVWPSSFYGYTFSSSSWP